MTVTLANLGQVASVVRDCRAMGYGMFSFQPAAFVGDDRRWHEDNRDLTGDQVWAQVEAGAGTLQIGMIAVRHRLASQRLADPRRHQGGRVRARPGSARLPARRRG